MSPCEKLIAQLTCNLPETCRVNDLIQAGIFQSAQNAYSLRHSDIGPPYVMVGGKVLYPKDGVVNWLQKRKFEYAKQENCNDSEETNCCKAEQQERVANCCRAANIL